MADRRRVEELEKLLRAAELRAAESDKQLRQERQRVEESDKQLHQEQQRADREQQRAEASEELSRPTTLYEYIAACHSLVFSKLTVERDRALTSKGSITNPRNKLCPTSLKPWPDFIEQQRIASGAIHGAIPENTRPFESRSFLSGLGNRISQRPIANEKGLEYFLHNSVEDPVRSILHQLKEAEQINNIYDIRGGIIFENHPSAISDVAEEVIERENSSPPRTPDQGRVSNQLRPDQICVYRSDDATSARRSMVYVCEYKPPHKLTAPHIRAGLRPMNVYKEVVNRKTVPTSADPDGLFQYHAERLTAAAISQTYHYMMEGGLEYGLLTTGETIVFLKVDWDEPTTLFYHLAEPNSEVSAHPNNLHACTAVGQYLAFTLLALGSPGQRREHGQEERRTVIMGLKTWVEDFESTLRSIPASERSAPGDSIYTQPTTYITIDRSPYLFRFKRVPVIYDDKPEGLPTRTHSPESSDDDAAQPAPETPSPAERRWRGQAQGTRRSQRIHAQRSSGSASKPSAEQAGQYCTQKCLMGLVKGTRLDMSCPNVRLHSKHPAQTVSRLTTRHSVSHEKWLHLLRQQLEESLDNGVTPLGEVGSRGALFRVTLIKYGYVFISKGTVRAFIEDLEHESAVYKRLESLQGVTVPVFLGSIDLRPMQKLYYYDHRVYIVYMSFLSWAGYKLDNLHFAHDVEKRLADKTLHSLRALHVHGVVHKDMRGSNMMFNPETNCVMIIDFERSLLVQPARRALNQIIPNKRPWTSNTTEEKLSAASRPSKSRIKDIREDIIMAKTAFFELSWDSARL